MSKYKILYKLSQKFHLIIFQEMISQKIQLECWKA